MNKIFTSILLLLNFTAFAQIHVQWKAMVSLQVIFGTQTNAMNLGVNVGAVTAGYGVASEWNAGVQVETFSKKFGVKTKGSALSWESYVILGPDNDHDQQPFYSGDLSLNERVVHPSLAAMVYGAGVGVRRDMIKGDLKPLANQQGIFITRIKLGNRPLTIRIKNDFKSFLFFGGGTDQGTTGSGYIEYAFLDQQGYLHHLGLFIGMFTPVPDYTQNPTLSINSDYDSKAVLPTKGPFSDLFHGNFYVNYSMASLYFDQQVQLGVDSQRWGAKVQNSIHDGLGLYARFPWDVSQKNQWYFQSQTSIRYGN